MTRSGRSVAAARAELGTPRGGRVPVRSRTPSGLNGGLDDVVRGREVGLTGTEPDDRVALGLERLDILDALRLQVVHGLGNVPSGVFDFRRGDDEDVGRLRVLLALGLRHEVVVLGNQGRDFLEGKLFRGRRHIRERV